MMSISWTFNSSSVRPIIVNQQLFASRAGSREACIELGAVHMPFYSTRNWYSSGLFVDISLSGAWSTSSSLILNEWSQIFELPKSFMSYRTHLVVGTYIPNSSDQVWLCMYCSVVIVVPSPYWLTLGFSFLLYSTSEHSAVLPRGPRLQKSAFVLITVGNTSLPLLLISVPKRE